MPRRLTQQQKDLIARLMQIERQIDATFLQLSRDVDRTVRQYRGRALSDADLPPLLQRIDAVLDPVYGATRPSVPRTSSIYRLIQRTAEGTIEDVYRESYRQLRMTIEPTQPELWRKLDGILSVGGNGPDDELAVVKRMLTGDHVARERVMRSRSLDVQRRWVPKEKWNTKTGYRLSDRLWNHKAETRAKIDELTREAIKNGTDPIALADDLEGYLNPEYQVRDITLPDGTVVRKNVTSLPRGGSGSFPARRLAITEIQRINGAATLESSKVIPGVIGAKWLLSNNHPADDECDQNARNHSEGMEAGCYTAAEFPAFPNHPLDRCSVSHVHMSRQETIDQIVKKYTQLAEAA
jgi:hypothetical protein